MIHKKRKAKKLLILIRVLKAWKKGILFWNPSEPFQTECLIVWAFLFSIFFFSIPWILQKTSTSQIFIGVLYLVILGYANFGLKKLCES